MAPAQALLEQVGGLVHRVRRNVGADRAAARVDARLRDARPLEGRVALADERDAGTEDRARRGRADAQDLLARIACLSLADVAAHRHADGKRHAAQAAIFERRAGRGISRRSDAPAADYGSAGTDTPFVTRTGCARRQSQERDSRNAALIRPTWL